MPQHARAYRVSLVWTLLLLFLGSVVHATESSLACPDWPTCFGTMMPEMTGGVFWEHLHRLVAGGLVLMFLLATWLTRREAPGHPWLFKATLGGVGLLLVQSVFGGLTVLYQLPDLVSTSHLGLAFLFLALVSVLTAYTATPAGPPPSHRAERRVGVLAATGGALVFVQSVLGALVRHMDAGMACPDVPLCLGQVVPPLVNAPITVHFTHRVLAVLVTVFVLGAAAWAMRSGVSHPARRWLGAAAALVVVQVGLGVASVLTVLSVSPVALHTLVAAALLSALVQAATVALAEPGAMAAHEGTLTAAGAAL